jgi:hypothetical protein
MNRTVLAAAMIAAGVLSGADEKKVENREHNCQISVPASWDVSTMSGLASAPDKSFTVAMSSPKMVDSFAKIKEIAQATYKRTKVTKDSATEFEMEGQSLGGKPNVYRAIPVAGNRFCLADVTYTGAGVEEARRIARTMKGTK